MTEGANPVQTTKKEEEEKKNTPGPDIIYQKFMLPKVSLKIISKYYLTKV